LRELPSSISEGALHEVPFHVSVLASPTATQNDDDTHDTELTVPGASISAGAVQELPFQNSAHELVWLFWTVRTSTAAQNDDDTHDT
jgi:hypothetical protein